MPDNTDDKTAHTSGDPDESSTGITADNTVDDDADEGGDDDSTVGGSGALFAACHSGSPPRLSGQLGPRGRRHKTTQTRTI